ncbi:metal ABC transporter solute-binding protein, Zn/Mn family [Desulforhopalus singaporensis]|uniref:Zinc transport system substrate-binding protein n=1 Tax=Desulforhopalus singaporensis TaxID=91360 RepID=A0A1H0QAG6_9BACT|nr:zinc ABC transporter substrate-binding protein [Desulforhopalus singaporensis]SDP14372.1 zinc transport system substrate-binding protein [Desulforhopalus singaporensis]
MHRLNICLLMFFVLFTGCFPACAEPEPMVFVSILPQKYLVQQVGKDLVHVEVMVQPGASPATYEPKPSQMRKLKSSSVYFAIGVPFEQAWLTRISRMNPQMTVVHTDAGVTKRAMKKDYSDALTHDEAHPADGHFHEGLDPHIWLSPPLVKQQVVVIRQTLEQLLPNEKHMLRKNEQQLLELIDDLDRKLQKMFSNLQDKRFLVFHPTWGYFADHYGLEQIAIEIEGKSPKPAQLRQLIGYARKNDIRVIFVQPQFSVKSAEIVAKELDGRMVTADPLAGDWLMNMEKVGAAFVEVLRK